MTYVVSFNPDTFREQYNVYWKTITAKTKKNTNMYALYGSIMVIFFFVLHRAEVKYFVLGYGICSLALAIGYYLIIRRDESRKQAHIQHYINNYNRNKVDTIWQFDSEHLAIKDYQSESVIKWCAFRSHKVIGETLFISYTDTIHYASIIGVDDVGPEAFKEIVAFIKQKIPAESK